MLTKLAPKKKTNYNVIVMLSYQIIVLVIIFNNILPSLSIALIYYFYSYQITFSIYQILFIYY